MLFKKNVDKKITVNWLAFKGVIRYNLWVLIKIMIFVLWGFAILNMSVLYFLKIELKYNFLEKWILLFSVILLNIFFLLFSYTIFSLTLKKRQNEFGILRALGSTRSEIFKLILQESIIIPLISSVIILLIEIIFLFKFKLKICGILNIQYDLVFIKTFLVSFILTLILQFLIVFISLLPSAIYFSRLNPYYILRY